MFADVLELITKSFCGESHILPQNRLLLLNLDETNSLLSSDDGKQFLKKLIRILWKAAGSFSLLTILSGTHSVGLFEQMQISQCKFVDIELPLIELQSAKEILLGMTSDPNAYHISPYLEYVLKLLGGVGRYIEVAITQMSIIGASKNDSILTFNGFSQFAYEYFLKNLQTPQEIDILLTKLNFGIVPHYPKVFSKYADYIELLYCYTIFRW